MRLANRDEQRERGAVAVEMAIVVPVLVLMAFGMLEFGLAFKNKLDMSHAVNQATRNATVLGTDDYADIEILNALEAGLKGDLSTVNHVDIFIAELGLARWAKHRIGHSPIADEDYLAVLRSFGNGV